VDEANFEESDLVEVRARSFPAGRDFFDQDHTSQFGEDEDDWEDEDEEEGPDCRPQ
jgi:DnaJ family protein A protein 2